MSRKHLKWIKYTDLNKTKDRDNKTEMTGVSVVMHYMLFTAVAVQKLYVCIQILVI